MASSAPETPIVSVIVPACNVERWLDECLESVAGQTIGPRPAAACSSWTTGPRTPRLERARTFAADKALGCQVLHAGRTPEGPVVRATPGSTLQAAGYVFFLDADDYLPPARPSSGWSPWRSAAPPTSSWRASSASRAGEAADAPLRSRRGPRQPLRGQPLRQRPQAVPPRLRGTASPPVDARRAGGRGRGLHAACVPRGRRGLDPRHL